MLVPTNGGRIGAFLLIFAIGIFAQSCYAQGTAAPSANDLYLQAQNAASLCSYSGHEFATSFREDGRSTSFLTYVQHLAPDQYRITYEAPSMQNGKVILQDSHQQWIVIPKRSLVIHSYPALPLAKMIKAEKYALLNNNYSIQVSKQTAVVAGRQVDVIEFDPRNRHGLSRKLWIDASTGVILRNEQTRSDGTLAFVSYFSDIDYHPNFSPSTFSSSGVITARDRIVEQKDPPESIVAHSQLSKVLGVPSAAPLCLGTYNLESASIMMDEGKPTVHLRYSDGLGSLSLFETRRVNSRPTLLSGSDVRNVRGLIIRILHKGPYTLVNWDEGDLNLTLVGDSSSRLLSHLAREVVVQS